MGKFSFWYRFHLATAIDLTVLEWPKRKPRTSEMETAAQRDLVKLNAW
jgi:hypothetical protein